MAFADEVKTILTFWASHCGSWMDLDIEDKLLAPLIEQGYLSDSEIKLFNLSSG